MRRPLLSVLVLLISTAGCGGGGDDEAAIPSPIIEPTSVVEEPTPDVEPSPVIEPTPTPTAEPSPTPPAIACCGSSTASVNPRGGRSKSCFAYDGDESHLSEFFDVCDAASERCVYGGTTICRSFANAGPCPDDCDSFVDCWPDGSSCERTWAGRCSPTVRTGTCYYPALPPPTTPAQLALKCCAGECIAARATIGSDCR